MVSPQIQMTSNYSRHHKIIVRRVLEACGGKGFYIQGDYKLAIARLYQEIVQIMDKYSPIICMILR